MDSNGVACQNVENAASPVRASQFAGDSGAHGLDAAAHPTGKRRGRTALVVGLGSTILSVVGFGALTLFEQYNSLVSEMRSDLKHFNETSSEYVKRDSFQRFRDTVKDRLFKELPEANLAKYRLEEELKASEKARTEMTEELRRLRERMAYLEGRQTVTTTTKAPPYSARSDD
ncbi:MAG TPA: hypothetical protein VKE94_16875 [Gemmataceae bacterium]|nr:hypothetical protein [Gemmataceae bacterium]